MTQVVYTAVGAVAGYYLTGGTVEGARWGAAIGGCVGPISTVPCARPVPADLAPQPIACAVPQPNE